MKYFLIVAIIVVALLLSAGCSSSKNAQAAKPEMTRCQDELNAIPEVSSIKGSSKSPDDEIGALSGMEISLTINRMFRSTSDPDRDQDDWCYTENTHENVEKLLNAIRSNGLPPTVNFLAGESIDLVIQEEWLRSGNLIGSMTYKGRSSKRGDTEEFIETLSRNEQEFAPLWSKFNRKQKYFRYPSLKLGVDARRPREIAVYLKENGFVEVPATIDARADYFSQPYCSALARGDKVCANFIGATFKSVLLDKSQKARDAARRIAGREVKHILLIQANQLTSDMLDEMLRWYKAMGVRFISIDEALKDPFYATEDVTSRANRILWDTKRAQGVKAPEVE
jgi:hypothetical protein